MSSREKERGREGEKEGEKEKEMLSIPNILTKGWLTHWKPLGEGSFHAHTKRNKNLDFFFFLNWPIGGMVSHLFQTKKPNNLPKTIKNTDWSVCFLLTR